MLTEMRLQIDDSILLSLKESKTTFIAENEPIFDYDEALIDEKKKI